MILGMHVEVEHLCAAAVAVAGALAAVRYYARKKEN